MTNFAYIMHLSLLAPMLKAIWKDCYINYNTTLKP